MAFWNHRKQDKKDAHLAIPTGTRAVLHCSICTGEQVAGFKDEQTGKFEEVCLIRDESDLKKFMETYGLESVPKEY